MKRKIIASILATTILATCAFTAVACSKDEDKPNNEANVGFEQTMVGGGMQIGESKGNGIQLMSTTLLASEYSDYGVAATAESAYTLSATITPSDAANHGVDWTLSWSNPSSSWASGKTVTDYVTVVPASSGAKTATVSCLQPFGTQVVITATSQDNPKVKANCTVDYAQKVTGVTLNFGNVPINLGGETYIKYEVSSAVNGDGGEITADIQTSEVYTISESFTKMVDLNYVGTGSSSVYFSLATGHPTGMDFMNRSEITNWYGEEVYFDYNHDICNWFIMTRAGDIMFDELTTAEIIEEFEGVTESTMYQITFTITGTHSNYSYSSVMKCNGYKNSTPVNALALSSTGYVF